MKLACLFRHKWASYGDNLSGQTGHVTLIWWECSRCGKSALRCIFHNRKSQHFGVKV